MDKVGGKGGGEEEGVAEERMGKEGGRDKMGERESWRNMWRDPRAWECLGISRKEERERETEGHGRE